MGTTKFPVLILVHGGGWLSGCRGVLRQEALLLTGKHALANTHFVSQRFIVFSADYRLACDVGTYTQFPDSPLPYLCGWRWDKVDQQEGHAQVAVHDIEGVITWIKDAQGWQQPDPGEPTSHYSNWDGKNIVVLGASAGGNISASAAADAANDSSIRPTATAILSGFPETGQTADPLQDWSCDSGSTMPGSCWTHVNSYLDCLNQNGQAPDHVLNACKTNGRYEAASPKNGAWNYPTTAPMFIANAGFGTGHLDLSPYQLAADFESRLLGANYSEVSNPPSLKFCKVNSSGHATGYLDKTEKSCEQDTGEVIESLVSFYVANLVP